MFLARLACLSFIRSLVLCVSKHASVLSRRLYIILFRVTKGDEGILAWVTCHEFHFFQSSLLCGSEIVQMHVIFRLCCRLVDHASHGTFHIQDRTPHPV